MFKYLIYLYLKWTGWKFQTQLPDSLRKFVMIGAPHTSNWDFFPVMAGSYLLNRDAHFLIKNKMAGLPIGKLFKFLGAIGVDRESIQEGKVNQSTQVYTNLFQTEKDFVLMIAPEGTRKANKKWKSGFWYVAHNAKVPIVLAYIDYSKKEAGYSKIIYPSDFETDMKEISTFYKDKKGLIQENFKLDERFDI